MSKHCALTAVRDAWQQTNNATNLRVHDAIKQDADLLDEELCRLAGLSFALFLRTGLRPLVEDLALSLFLSLAPRRAGERERERLRRPLKKQQI